MKTKTIEAIWKLKTLEKLCHFDFKIYAHRLFLQSATLSKRARNKPQSFKYKCSGFNTYISIRF